MPTIEEFQQVVRELLKRPTQSEEQLRTLYDQNQILSQTIVGQIPPLMEATERATSQRVAGGARTWVDARGLGRPESFAGTEADWFPWNRKFENFVSVVHPAPDVALGWAMEQHSSLTTQDIETAFGSEADLNEQIEGIGAMNSEAYALLTQLTSDESFDDAIFWGRSFSPALLRSTIPRGLSSGGEQVRRYERFCDGAGQRHEVGDDIKPSALESLVSTESEKHLQLSFARLLCYLNAHEDVRLYLESHLGRSLKGASISHVPLAVTLPPVTTTRWLSIR